MDKAASDKIRLWRERPDVFVREVFGATPDPWQDEELKAFPTNNRMAMKACAGPGKTALLAWLCWNFLLTRPHPNIMATAISGENLRDNLWKEMAKWQQKSPLLLAQFEWQAEKIFQKDNPATWFMSARRWSKSATSEQQGNTLRGAHGDYIMAVLDESGGIPQAVMATAENIGSSAKEWHIVQAGNPTHLEGPLYLACTKGRALWRVTEITADPDDPMRTSRVSKQWAQQQIDTYGRDHPWVLVNVFGKFPPASFNALIGPDEVAAALGKHARIETYSHAAKVLGVDVARFGDDESVVFPRQGLASFTPLVMRHVDSTLGGGAVARKWNDWSADACFIDGTGGYGGGWRDNLKQLGRHAIEIPFSGKAQDPRYFNKRAEMWFAVVQWIREGGALPNVPEMVAELSQCLYTFKGDKFLIEEKDQLKMRIGRSPNYTDALGLTFAQPVMPGSADLGSFTLASLVQRSVVDYDPLERQ